MFMGFLILAKYQNKPYYPGSVLKVGE